MKDKRLNLCAKKLKWNGLLFTLVSRFRERRGRRKRCLPGTSRYVAFNCIRAFVEGVAESRGAARGEETQQYTAKPVCVRAGNSACCRLLIARLALAKPLITHERVISYPLLGVRRTSALIAAPAETPLSRQDTMKGH